MERSKADFYQVCCQGRRFLKKVQRSPPLMYRKRMGDSGKKMKKRLLALLLAGMLGLSGAGCGQNSQGKTENDGQDTTEAVEAEGEPQATALSLMRQMNAGEENVPDDNYRTWYEVFVYSFYDSDGDGIGDLKGLTEKLDYINDGDPATDTDLGCNGIWLMPVMPSPTYHKYDVKDYCAIDEEYGTMEDFQTLLEECHKRGIHVIIDLVMNHSSSMNPWFLQASEYLKELPEGAEPDAMECPYVDYYYFSKEKKGGYSPLPGSDWFYEAQFWSEMPDLNLGNEAVRAEFETIVDFWLEMGVDGFRLDAAKEYYSGGDEANIEVLTWFNTMVKEKKQDAYIVAEVWNDMPTYAKYYASGIDSCFDFAFANAEGVIAEAVNGKTPASSYGKAMETLQESLGSYSDSYIDAPFYTNHDMARGAGYYAGDYSENQTKIAQAMNLFMSGSAFLYYGEELGMKGAGKDENKRAPMYWSEDAAAEGMCKGPADMDSVKMKYGSWEAQMADGNSIYSFVKEAIRLRNRYPEIARGTVKFEEALSGETVCAIRKTYENEEALIVFNISKDTQTVEISEMELAGMLVTGTESVTFVDGTLTLPPYSVAVLK